MKDGCCGDKKSDVADLNSLGGLYEICLLPISVSLYDKSCFVYFIVSVWSFNYENDAAPSMLDIGVILLEERIANALPTNNP